METIIRNFLSFTDGYGSGNGYGSGSGYGYGSGYDSGNGDGSGIKSYNCISIHIIDGIQTGITHIKNNIAKGFVLKSDLTTTNCYIVKQNNLFAHGSTLKEAYESLHEKFFQELLEEEKIEEFKKQFNMTDKYPAKTFFDWHNKLTGSCLFGRKAFVNENDINLDVDMFTVAEFVELTKNSYGGDVIRKITEVN